MADTLPLAFFSMPGGIEWIVIGLVALLLFGKRLPGVARSLGQALHEFKSGLAGQASGERDGAGSGTDALEKNGADAKPVPPGAGKPDGE